MTGGEIQLTGSNSSGITNNGGTTEMTGGEIHLTGDSSNGIVNKNSGTVNIKEDAAISYDSNDADNVILIENYDYSTLNMTGGSLTNLAMYGGCRLIYSNASYDEFNKDKKAKIVINNVTMECSSISSNSNNYAIYENGVSEATIESCKITCKTNNCNAINLNSVEAKIENNTINSNTNGINIYSGTLEMKENTINVSNCGIYIDNSANVIIKSGTITSKATGVQVTSGTFTLGEKGGEVSITEPLVQGATYGVNNSSTFNFYDGLIKGKTAAINGNTTAKETGYIIDTATDSTTGYISNTLSPEGGKVIVATVGENSYSSLRDAISACTTGGEIITMQRSVSLGSDPLEIADNQNITINLNGKDITSANDKTIVNNGKLVIKDTSTKDYGTISNTSGVTITNNGTLEIGLDDKSVSASSPRITSSSTTIVNNGTMNFYDGIIIGTKAVSGNSINGIPDDYILKTTTSGSSETVKLTSSGMVLDYNVINNVITITGSGVKNIADSNGNVTEANSDGSIIYEYDITKSGTYTFTVTGQSGYVKTLNIDATYTSSSDNTNETNSTKNTTTSNDVNGVNTDANSTSSNETDANATNTNQ